MTPGDLVRSLTIDGLSALRSEVAEGRAENALRSLRQRDAGAEIVREQYAGRYPLELVQNANDAVAADGVEDARIKFVVTESALLVADTGAGFGVNQVESICDLAQSSKDPRKSVGYKGLGFKSVAEVTDTPQIISGELRFGFDRARLRREVESIIGHDLDHEFPLPDYAFPFELTHRDLATDGDAVADMQAQGYQTVLRLPFRDKAAAESAAVHVADMIVPRLLLFLDAAESLELVGTSADFHAQALRDGDDARQYVILEAGDRSEQFMVYRKQVPVPEPALVTELGKAWRDVEAVRISAAAPLDDSGELFAPGAEPLHVYFPTEESTGLSMIFNADYQVELDRRRIATTGAPGTYNEWLINEFAAFVADVVVPDLTQRFGGAATVNVFAPHCPPAHTGERLTAAIYSALTEVAWIPCQDGELRALGDVWIAPSSVPDVSLLHEWLEAPELVHLEVDADKRSRELLATVLKCDVMPERTALSSLEPPPAADAPDFYRFLVDWSQSANLLAHWLKECKCVLLVDGEWVRPTDDPRPFLPRQRTDEEFPPGLQIPVADLPEIEGVVDLLQRAEMKPLTWRALITDFLMPRLTDPELADAERSGALAILRSYFDSIRRDGSGDREIRESVTATLLPARGHDQSTELELRPASALYFGADWMPDAELEKLYGPLGEADFLAAESSNVEEDRSFFKWLGVNPRPAVIDLAPAGGSLRLRASDAYRAATTCPQGHPQSQRLESAPAIDRVEQILAEGDEERSSVLWRHLVGGWETVYRASLVANWRCSAAAHKGERDRPFQSEAAQLLTAHAWVPAIRSGRRRLARPGEVWRPAHGSPAALQTTLTTLAPDAARPSQAMADALGLVDAARAGAAAIVDLLEDLEQEATGLDVLPEHFATAGRWLLAQLEEADGLDNLEPGSVPVVARVQNRVRFVRRPFLVRDHILADAWSDAVAIYDGDTHLPRVFEALDIRVLDALVGVTPLPADTLEDYERQVTQQLTEVAPTLVATASVDYGSRRDEVAQRLSALKVVCTSELALKFTLQSHDPRHYLGASAFIDSGVAYLEVDEEEPDWLAFGLRLAEYVDVLQLGDAFALLLAASPRGRDHYLQTRHISEDDLKAAEGALRAEFDAPGSSEFTGWEYHEDSDHGADETDPEPDDSTEASYDLVGPDDGSRGSSSGDVNRTAQATSTRTHQRSDAKGSSPSGGVLARGVSDSGGSGHVPSSAESNRRGGRATAGSSGEGAASKPVHRFYSYVAAAGSREARMAERQDARSIRLGEHGVQRVVEYEASRGRVATPQPHNNEGFDVVSISADGSDRRIIEVKATARDWPDRGVPVSDSQIRKNLEVGDEFWLYVVEYPEDPERARVTAVQNPMGSADYFAFDPGWRALGELDAGSV